MSDLRDARLKKALDAAPDADARPADAVREAILHKARLTAAASGPATTRRLRWWMAAGRPWNSALATAGAVAFVGVLVWNQGLLEQHPEEPGPVAAVPKAAPAPAASAAVAVPRATSGETAGGVVQERKRELRPRPPVPKVLAPTSVPQASVPARMESVPAPTQDSAAAPAPSLARPAPPAPALAYAPPPPPPAAPAPVMSARAVQEPRFDMTVSGSAVAQAWTALRLLTPQGPVLIPREQLPAGAEDLLMKALRSPARDEAAASGALAQGLNDNSPALRLELLLGEHLVGRLEFGANELRWTPAGQPTRVLRPGELAALRKALEAAAK